MEKSAAKILLVDDHPVYLAAAQKVLSKDYDVSVAHSAEEATNLFKSGKYDILITDVVLPGESGIDLAKRLGEADPDLRIILNSVSPERYWRQASISADACLEKTDMFALIKFVQRTVSLKKMPHQIRLMHLSILFNLQGYMDVIDFVHMAGDKTGALRMEGVLKKDKSPVAWVTYVDPSLDKKRVVICLASTVGCIGRCEFCKSGTRPFQRKLSKKEMISQFLHSMMRSYHLKDVFEKPMDLTVNWACEGDGGVTNTANVYSTVETLSRIKGLDLKFILTTIGSEKKLRDFLTNHSDLPIRFYWSLHFRPEIRPTYMPATARQNVEKIRDILQKIAEKTGRPITVAWALMEGKNDGQEDLEYLEKMFSGRPFEIKISQMRGEILDGQIVSDESTRTFVNRLKARGLPTRARNLVGTSISATCGSTVPSDFPISRSQK